MTKQEEQGARLEHILGLLKIDQTDLARLSKRSPSLINQIIKGKKKLSNAVLTGLTDSYTKVNLTWILNGVGEPMAREDLVKKYQFEDGQPRTLEDLEAEYKNDPLAGLRDLIARVEELEKWKAEVEGREK